jgi:hypothetical protein
LPIGPEISRILKENGSTLHTILGAIGVIARELSRALVAHTAIIRQVSRNYRKINPTDETSCADLLDSHSPPGP